MHSNVLREANVTVSKDHILCKSHAHLPILSFLQHIPLTESSEASSKISIEGRTPDVVSDLEADEPSPSGDSTQSNGTGTTRLTAQREPSPELRYADEHHQAQEKTSQESSPDLGACSEFGLRPGPSYTSNQQREIPETLQRKSGLPTLSPNHR